MGKVVENKFSYISFYMPERVYIPFDSTEKLKIRKNKLVYCGEYMGNMNDGTSIYSSVSGIIEDTSNILCEDKFLNSLVITNDFKDKRFKINGGKRIFDNYKRKDANDILIQYNLDRKYNSKRHLIIDFMSFNNNLENRYISVESSFEFLETIDSLLSIYNLDNAFVAVNDNVSLKYLMKFSRMYPNIEFCKRVIKNDNAVYYNGFEIMEIYNAFKYNKKLNEKYVTLVNDKKITMVKTKLNILVIDLLKVLKVSYNNISVLTSDNKLIDNYNGIITKNINSIVIS